MAISLEPLGQGTDLTVEELVPKLRSILQDVEEQLNQRANIYVSTDGKIPTNLQKNDLLVVATSGTISLYVRSAKNFLQMTAAMLGGLSAHGSNFRGFITKTIAPALVDVPNANDWAFYTNSTTPAFFLIANFAGAIKKVALT